MTEKYVYLENLDRESSRACDECPAKGKEITDSITHPFCKLARLERKLGREPKIEEVKLERIDVSNTPDDCPYKYDNLF